MSYLTVASGCDEGGLAVTAALDEQDRGFRVSTAKSGQQQQ